MKDTVQAEKERTEREKLSYDIYKISQPKVQATLSATDYRLIKRDIIRRCKIYNIDIPTFLRQEPSK